MKKLWFKQDLGRTASKMMIVLLIMVMMLSCVFISAAAEEYLGTGTISTDEGTLQWSLSYDGMLYIEGTGPIPDYGEDLGYAPWYSYASEVDRIVVDNGVTAIGDYAFYYCTGATALIVGEDVEYFGDYALYKSGIKGIYFLGDAPAFNENALYNNNYSYYSYLTCIYYPELADWGNVISNNYGTYYVTWYAAYKPQATTITAVSNKATGAIDITWESAKYAYEYDIYRKAEHESEYTLLETYSVVTTHSDTDIEMGVKYSYYVVVRSEAARESAKSNVVSARQKLPAPTVTISAVAATGKNKLSWDTIEGASGYRIYRSTSKSSGFKAIKLIKDNNVTSYTDTSAVAGTKYYYKVVATHSNSNGNSSYSGLVGRTTDLARPVVKTSNNAKTGKIVLSWKKISGAAGYKIYRSTSSDGTYKLIKTVTDATVLTYTDSSGTAGVKYYYKVMAIHDDTGANSAYSQVVSRVRDLKRPTVTVTNDEDSGKVKLSWNMNSNASGYKIYRSTSKNGTYSAIKYIKNSSTVSYVDKTAAAGTKYYYKVVSVCAESSAGNSAASAIVSRLCDCAKPSLKVASSSLTSIKISWDKVGNANGYYIYRSTSKNGTYKKIATVTSTSYADKSVKAGTTYYYKAIARNSNSGANSQYSAVVSAKATIGAPTMNTTATATKKTISFSWNKVSGASGYYIYRRSSATGSWKKIDTVKSTVDSYKDTVSAGVYYYCVEAYKTSNGTKYSSLKSEQIQLRTLTAPSGVDSKAWDGELKNDVTWNKVSGATGYQIYYKAGKDGEWKRAATVKGNTTCSYVHEVGHGAYYYYKVRPVYTKDGVTSYGPYTEQTTGLIHYYYPKVSTFMSSKYDSSCYAMLVYVTNNGVAPIYFYGDGARSVDYDSSSWNRDLTMTDKDLNPVEYTVIQPGESAFIYLLPSKSTWYDSKTRVVMDVYYDGMWYTTYTSSKYGFNYYKKD